MLQRFLLPMVAFAALSAPAFAGDAAQHCDRASGHVAIETTPTSNKEVTPDPTFAERTNATEGCVILALITKSQ